MSFNSQMHPRNIYKDRPPDFNELAKNFAEFRNCCNVSANGKVKLNFKDPNAVRALTSALLLKDFGLRVELPPDCLVPRIPQRLNYILWLEDILLANGQANAPVRGVDIGTGASCVYPLLGARQCNWRFVATERDAAAAACARRNVAANGLADAVTVVDAPAGAALRGVVDTDDGATFDFCMCNPPFYAAADAAADVARPPSTERTRRAPPHSATVARPNETCVEGGEVAFVRAIIDDSAHLRHRIRVYTSMVGKKSSLAPLKAHLHHVGAVSLCETTFCQGKTLRWAIAWTFDSAVTLADGKRERPPSVRIELPSEAFEPFPLASLTNIFKDMLRSLRISVDSEDGARLRGCEAALNTWSQQRRKRRALRRLAAASSAAAGVTGVDFGGMASMGSGDGRDSLSVSGLLDVCDCSPADDVAGRRTVGVQACASAAALDAKPIAEPLARFDLDIVLQSSTLCASFNWKSGRCPESLNQIAQFCRNQLLADSK